jgi:8-oxo-dGTP pyrophosphatase MutT (NUDIX family)
MAAAAGGERANEGEMSMADDWPKIVSRRTTRVSPWMEIIEREVAFAPGVEHQLYHAVGQHDHLAIVARTPDERIPIVRQYRPAVERFTWELPAGLIEKGEQPEASCRRELMEETGFPARSVHSLGAYASCTARLSNQIHSFFVETGERAKMWQPEAGIGVKQVTPAELASLILSGEFELQLHIAVLLLAGLRGLIDLGTLNT